MPLKVLENIFTINLGVKEDERALVFTDYTEEKDIVSVVACKEIADIAQKAFEAGNEHCTTSYLEYLSTGQHGTEPPEAAWREAFGERTVDALLKEGLFGRLIKKQLKPGEIERCEEIVSSMKGDAMDAVVALSKYSTSHTSFRRLLTGSAGARVASMPNFDALMLDGVMTVDWQTLRDRTLHLAKLMKGAESVRVTCPNGTDISFSIKGRTVHADTGDISAAGAFSNLPAGEAFCAPVEGTAQGTLVLEWAPMRKLESQVVLQVKNGLVISVEGDEDYVQELAAELETNQNKGNIAELGIGTNDKATRPDNILESEKILGTIHIALGDNSTFGGTVRVPFHQDYVFFEPTLEVTKGKESFLVLEKGRAIF